MDVDLEFEASKGELKVLHNEPGGFQTRENAFEYDPDPCTLINIRIQTVQYGVYDGRPAALIVLKFIIRFRAGSKRIRNFHANIEFQNQTPIAGLPQPKIVGLKPEDVRGRIFTEERGNTFTAGLGVPLGPPGAPTIEVSDEIARTVNREYDLKLTGWKTGSSDSTDNVLVWDCAEAKKSARGVVPNYLGACIVEYTADQPFIATFTLDAQRGIFNFGKDKNIFEYLNVFAKRNVDDPVIFDPTRPVGHQYPDLADFEEVDLETLVKLDPIGNLPNGYS